MAYSDKDIANLVVDFLVKSIEKKSVSEENADSLNVAIDCISEAFEFEKDSVKSTIKAKFNGKSLEEILTSSGTSTSSSSEEIKVNVSEEQENTEAKAKAEALKLEGNKAMASKDYDLAIEKYTAAIASFPTNAVYFANRAAAYSSQKKYEEAVEDAKSAIKVNPSYSKGYSRLGFAKFAQGNTQDALEAYKKVLDIEGDKATDAMKRDYETAKKKVELSLNLEKTSSPTPESASEKADNTSRQVPQDGAAFPDMSSLLGGGLGSFLNNPQIMQAAQQMMSNPRAMEQMESMMQNPSVRQMAENLSSGNTGGAGLGDFMNNPAIQEMAKNLFGGANPTGSPSNEENSNK